MNTQTTTRPTTARLCIVNVIFRKATYTATIRADVQMNDGTRLEMQYMRDFRAAVEAQAETEGLEVMPQGSTEFDLTGDITNLAAAGLLAEQICARANRVVDTRQSGVTFDFAVGEVMNN